MATLPLPTLQAELDAALTAAERAGRVLVGHSDNPRGWEKSADNPVTLADLEADAAITQHLREAFPEDAFLSEETAPDLGRVAARRTWVIDPLDGTKEFIARLPEYAVSIALVCDGEPHIGVILNPAAGVAVFAARNAGTWRAPWSLNHGLGTPKRVTVSPCTQLADAVVIASRTEISRKKFDPYNGWFRELRPIGSIAWKLGCVACGDGDLNVSVVPKNEWDVCAGDLLVREAGGMYVDFAGKPRRYNQPNPLIEASMTAGPPSLVDAFCARVRNAQPLTEPNLE